MARLVLASCILGLLVCAYAVLGHGNGNKYGSGSDDSEVNHKKGGTGSRIKCGDDGHEGSHHHVSGASEKDPGYNIRQIGGSGMNGGERGDYGKLSNVSPKPLESSKEKYRDSNNEHNGGYKRGSDNADGGTHDNQSANNSKGDSKGNENRGKSINQGGEKNIDHGRRNDGVAVNQGTKKDKDGGIHGGENDKNRNNRDSEKGQKHHGSNGSGNGGTQDSPGDEKYKDENKGEHDNKDYDKKKDNQKETGAGSFLADGGSQKGSNCGGSLSSGHEGHNLNNQGGTKVGYGK